MAEEQTIDESLYSRQLYVLGEEAMKKMNASSALIIGMKGLGVEIAKNIILAGVKTIAIHDNEPVAIRDMTSNFYITEEDLGKPRAEVCLSKLASLNPYVSVSRRVEDINEDYIKTFRIVVATNMKNGEVEILDSICRKNNVCFIAANTYGLAVRVFCDFGDSFTITDYDDSEPASCLVGDISKDKEGLVTTADDRHPFQEGDMVTFSDVRGMIELNGCEPRPVHVLGNHQFTIGDTSSYSDYQGFGWCTQVKLPRTLHFRSLSECNKEPGEMLITDFGKMDHAMNLHIAVLALDEYMKRKQVSPKPWCDEDACEFVSICKEVNKGLKEEFQLNELNEEMLKTFAMTCCGEICCLTAAFGGIIAQEVLKACSNKFTPIHQFMYYDAFEALPERENHDDCKEIGSRYDGQILLFGQAIQQKLADSKIFLVGAGAIGCEMIKNLAMMGVATGNGCIYVTDMDRIERSNLSRQFLFRNSDIGHSKSETAVRVVKQMNPSIHAIAYEVKVGSDTEDVFTDQFMEDLTAVCNALDNVDARKYMDARCVKFDKPLLESGTLGTRGNTQIVIPFLTESYGSTNDPQEQSIPMCTLKNFPYKIEHTIQWSRDLFEGLFTQSIQTLTQYRDKPDYLESLSATAEVYDEAIRSLHALLVEHPCSTYDDCIRWAYHLFYKHFNLDIQQLIYQFPKDYIDENGREFWSGNKLYPSPIDFDEMNTTHLQFVDYAAILHAQSLGITVNEDKEYFMNVIHSIQKPVFVPIDTNNANTNDFIRQLKEELPKPESIQQLHTAPAEFEKDDDSNHHIDFIAACANLRAQNYGITTADRNTIKKIAGKIIPAISTTTAFVTGTISLELLKIACELKKIENYRSCFANLSMPMFCFTEPGPCHKTTIGSMTWSEWDHIFFKKTDGETIEDFIAYIEEKYNLHANSLYWGEQCIFGEFIPATQNRLTRSLSEVWKEISKSMNVKGKYFEMVVMCDNDDFVPTDADPFGEDIILPTVFVEI